MDGSINPLSDAKIVESWKKNAAPWTHAVRGQEIPSRKLVTDRAIIDAVTGLSPASVLDIGCGEGWLVRALAELGIQGVGVDVVPELVEQARRAGGGDFRVASYEDIAAGALEVTVDVAVANFSLIGENTVESLLIRLHALLNTGGSLVIQTLHPVTANAAAGLPYMEGWRPGSWAGFSSEFTDPAPWYFRTLEGWVHLLERCKWRLHELREPLHPETRQPASVIFIARAAG